MVYILFIALSIMFVTSYVVSKGDLISPAVIFSLSFLFQSMWVLLYAKRWDLGLHMNTLIVISTGVFCFMAVSFITSAGMNCGRFSPAFPTASQTMGMHTNSIMEIAFLEIGIIIIVTYLYFILKVTGTDITDVRHWSSAIGEYDRLLKFTNNYEAVKLPFLVNNLRGVIIAAGYWFLYVILNNYFAMKRIKIIQVLIVLVSIFCMVASGGRTGVFMLIAAGIAFVIIITQKKDNIIDVLNIKRAIAISMTAIIFMGAFLSFGIALGRNIDYSVMDYLSIYAGAQVKNLDIWLQNPVRTNDIWGSQTFFSMVMTVGEKIGFDGYARYSLDLPFQSVNGTGLGNVYTTFYPYIYDFGYVGSFVLTAIMAFISQWAFQRAKRSAASDGPSLSVLMYGSIFGCLLLSFFSNKFYENIISMNMLKNIVYWLFFNCIFTGKVRVFKTNIVLSTGRRKKHCSLGKVES